VGLASVKGFQGWSEIVEIYLLSAQSRLSERISRRMGAAGPVP
jgi:hypothetical protein